MPQVRDYIQDRFDNADLSTAEREDWAKFKPVLAGTDLESALKEHHLTERLEDRLVRLLQALFLEHDQRLFSSLVNNELDLPLSRFFRHYLKTTHKTLTVVTTNYDRLIEFIADWTETAVYTGFSYGYARRFNPKHPWRIYHNRDMKPTIDLWKVHGSTDWYQTKGGRQLGAAFPPSPTEDFAPLMIYPGTRKFESAWAEPYRTIISEMDEALQKAQAYITVGYGFNDEHIQAKVIDRIRSSSVPLICLTKQLTPSARALLLKGQCRRFLALQEARGGTTVFSDDNLSGSFLPGEYWSLDGFLKLIS